MKRRKLSEIIDIVWENDPSNEIKGKDKRLKSFVALILAAENNPKLTKEEKFIFQKDLIEDELERFGVILLKGYIKKTEKDKLEFTNMCNRIFSEKKEQPQ